MTLEQHISHAEKTFVETQGYRAANLIIRQHRRLIVTGKSGQGKSYLAHHLLNKIIADNSDMKPLIVSTVKQWRTLVDSSISLGIIVDDMCGKVCLNEGELMKWREESFFMPTLIENGKHVVIFIMKSTFHEKILVTLQSHALFAKQIILNLDTIGLKSAEKTAFVNTYLKGFGLNDAEISKLCEIQKVPLGFPQLCKAAETIKDKPRLFGLFSRPREMILEQIKQISQDDNMTYACLALVMLSGGKLNLQSIREIESKSEKIENIAISVFKLCGITDVIPFKVIDTLKSIQGIYLSFDATVESCSFAHDSIEEAVFISYIEFFPTQTLLYCPLQLLCKLCTIKYDSKALETITEEKKLILQPCYETIFINRFTRALRGGNPADFTMVSEANVWSCKDFRKVFFAQCKEIHVLADKDENSLLVHAANANNHYLVDALLHALNLIPERGKKKVAQSLTKSAKALCAHKDTCLIEKMCKNGFVHVNDILPITVQIGSIHAITFLLQSVDNANYRSKDGENLLHIACFHGRLDIVKLLYSQNANLVNSFVDCNQDVGPCVAAGGSVEILEFLLPLGLNPLHIDANGWNLLHYACFQAKKDMAEHLMVRYPNLIYSETGEGMSVLFCAALGGNIHIFKKICILVKDLLKAERYANEIRNLMRKTKRQQTLLHMSCLRGSIEMTEYLVETYPTTIHEKDNTMKTPAHYAAESGNVAVIMYLIARGTDPWCRTAQNETLLHRACITNHLEMTKYLVKTYPTMLHEVDKDKMTPAHYAALGGNIAILRYLIDRGTDPWCRTSYGQTLLHVACISAQLEMAKYLVKTYPKMLHEIDNVKQTSTYYAALGGNVAVFSYLIARGADPWCRISDKETLLHMTCTRDHFEMTKYLVQTYPKMLHELGRCNTTPAHYAAQSGNIEVLKYLINRGTNPWCRTSEGETLLHGACIKGPLEMTKYLIKTYPQMLYEVDKRERTPAYYASHGGNIPVLSYLFACGTNPWCRTSDEMTLLHRACLSGQLEMTKYLVETFPGMLHEVDNGNGNAAHYAAESGNVSLLIYLIACGIDPWCRTSNEETLLHRACINGKLEITRYLVQTFPRMLYEVNNRKRNPAHYAAESRNIGVLRYLIDHGTDPWCTNSEGDTLLHRACFNGSFEMSKHLVEMYPRMIRKVNNSRRNPAHYAAESGNVAVLSYLIERGTDPWHRTAKNETLLHRACISGELEMTKYLVETYPRMLHEVDSSKRIPAYYAAHAGNVAVLIYLIDCGAVPWSRTSEKETLLHSACIMGQLEMTKYLVETYPKMLHEVDIMNRTPAHNAALSGNIAVLSYLIERGSDPWSRSSKEETLLHRACISGRLEMTSCLVDTYPKMIHEVDNCGVTPAHYAAQSGNIEILRNLFNHGADQWCRTFEKETLLHRACISGHLEMTKYLVQTYPKMIHEVDTNERTPAHYAAYTGNVAVLSYLTENGTNPWRRTLNKETLLHRAAINGQLEMTKYLVQTYPQMLHEVTLAKRTSAHLAAQSGNIEILSHLIDCGTDPWCRSSDGETLLHIACFFGRLEMIKYLVKRHPKMLRAVDNSKRTPAHDAANSGNIDVLKFLFNVGTDPLCRTVAEETLLHIACINGQLEMTKYLVQTFPKMLHEVDNNKRTSAHYAAQSGNIDVLGFLIECGANPWSKSANGETLLHISCFCGQLEMTRHLVETYPKMLHEADKAKRTPAHYAAKRRNVAVLSYLIQRLKASK